MRFACRAACGILTVCFASFLFGCHQTNSSSAGIQFVEVASRAGVNYAFKSELPPRGPQDPLQALTILETMGNGCAFFDYDNDGALDVLIVDRKLTLYKGDGKGHFQEVTKSVGLSSLSGHFMGCTVGDYDNDGWDDLYISGFQTGLLLHNEAGKKFRDVTQSAGLPPQHWGTSCGFLDADRDGLLDLFVANYVEFGTDPKHYTQRCEPVACGPKMYNPEFSKLYRNLGNGKFADVSQSSGILMSKGKSLAIGFADYDDDGDTDIMVANDEVAGDLFQNDGKGHFVNRALEAGTAFDVNGKEQGGMGVDWGDYDGDGRQDAVVSNYTEQPRSLYHNDGDGLFTNATGKVGIATPTLPYLAFGVKWLDYDNDGWLDLIFANGNVDNRIAVLTPEATYPQPMQVFHNRGGTPVSFSDESRTLGEALTRPIVGRGLATGDYDNDGRIDILVVDDVGPVRLLHNQGGTVGNWIGFSLVGTGRSNRDALGAKVTIETPDKRSQVREVQTASSYLSSSDRRLLFGIGTAVTVTHVTVRWPDGTTQHFENLAPGKYHVLKEGSLSL